MATTACEDFSAPVERAPPVFGSDERHNPNTRFEARVRKSRQKEAAGAADAGLMQIEWSEREVLKLARSARKRRRGPATVWERESRIDG